VHIEHSQQTPQNRTECIFSYSRAQISSFTSVAIKKIRKAITRGRTNHFVADVSYSDSLSCHVDGTDYSKFTFNFNRKKEHFSPVTLTFISVNYKLDVKMDNHI